jgi:hypothetical protein
MERNFTNENMEEFLRRNADGLRMRPSARVWKEITSQLNRRRRRTGFILGSSLLLITTLGYFSLNESGKDRNHNTINSNSRSAAMDSKQAFSVSEPTKQIQAVKTQQKRSNKVLSSATFESQDFSFTQTLFQRNEATIQNTFIPAVVDTYEPNQWLEKEKTFISQPTTLADPLSIESVVNSYKPKNKKFGWQMYFTPKVSYRILSDHTINEIIHHKPAFGFELGSAAKYSVSKKTKLVAGFQFNVNRYDIKTNDSYSQLATIKLVDRDGVDYVKTVTNYNNFVGYQPNWLQNLYVQVAAPVGVELQLSGDDKVQFGVASTVQPTYLLGDKAYLISSDYQNYIEMPNLVRRWNVNTSLQTFVNYSTGHIKWQVGPQVRYQILSSYLKKYPVKENLFDFGLRVGMSFDKK